MTKEEKQRIDEVVEELKRIRDSGGTMNLQKELGVLIEKLEQG